MVCGPGPDERKGVRYFSFLLIFFLAGCGTTGEAILRDVSEAVYGQSDPSEQEVARALKQALEVGLGEGAQTLSKENGFFGNPAVKILLPEEARKAEQTLRSLGFNKLCDDLILRLNRAAEKATTAAKPIFLNAIRQMTVRDAMDILFGADDAATRYLQRTTSEQLADAFQPVIQESLQEVNAVSLWNQVFTRYNQLPMVKKVNPELDRYVTNRALDGLFFAIAEEEKKIRENPLKRSTDLLRRVFGYRDKKTSE